MLLSNRITIEICQKNEMSFKFYDTTFNISNNLSIYCHIFKLNHLFATYPISEHAQNEFVFKVFIGR